MRVRPRPRIEGALSGGAALASPTCVASAGECEERNSRGVGGGRSMANSIPARRRLSPGWSRAIARRVRACPFPHVATLSDGAWCVKRCSPTFCGVDTLRVARCADAPRRDDGTSNCASKASGAKPGNSRSAWRRYSRRTCSWCSSSPCLRCIGSRRSGTTVEVARAWRLSRQRRAVRRDRLGCLRHSLRE